MNTELENFSKNHLHTIVQHWLAGENRACIKQAE